MIADRTGGEAIGAEVETKRVVSAPSRTKRLLFQALLAVLTTTVIAIAWIALFFGYRGRLHDYHGVRNASYRAPAFPGLTDAQILQLGWAQRRVDRPATSYLGAARRKPAGTVRIGVFGGSFVEGMETAQGHDLCTFLEADLRAAGLDHVRVLNFGVRQYGIHQAYLMWSYLGREYDLDYTVFLAFDWHAPRDDTFLFDVTTLGPLHARFVLDGDGVHLVPVAGRDRVDASRRYYSLLPPWRYLRYDARLPVLLRALVPGRADARFNPLYYERGHDDEILESYRRIFRAVALHSPKLAVVTDGPEMAAALAPLAEDGVPVLRGQLGEMNLLLSTPYKAPLGHRSALGNELHARELGAWLRAMEAPAVDVVHLDGNTIELPSTRLALDEVVEVDLRLGDQPLAGFALREDSTSPPWRLGADVDFEASGTESLLLLDQGGRLVFVPLPFRVRDGEAVELALESGEGAKRIRVGTVETRNQAIGRLDWSFDPRRSPPHGSAATLRSVQDYYFPGFVLEGTEPVESASLWIGDRLAMRGTIGDESPSRLPGLLRRAGLGSSRARRISFAPVVADFIGLRGKRGHYVEIDSVAPRGTVDWSSRDASGRVTRFTLLSYRIGRHPAEPFDRPHPNPLTGPAPPASR